MVINYLKKYLTRNQLPRITEEFIQDIEKNAKQGEYKIEIDGLNLAIAPYVFPPNPMFSRSFNLDKSIGDVKGKHVLDMGTGSGYLAIKAYNAGAKSVEAVDINEETLRCACENFQKNKDPKRAGEIYIYQSDLFSNITWPRIFMTVYPRILSPNCFGIFPGYYSNVNEKSYFARELDPYPGFDKRFDLIIANLPIVNYPCKDERFLTLLDPDFNIHKRFFSEAGNYLKEDGRIIMTHADLQGKRSFEKLENLAKENEFIYTIKNSINELGYEWRTYEFRKNEKS
ncbi:MAG: Rossmann-like fold-containing protein [Nanoarchaeota archaeon]